MTDVKVFKGKGGLAHLRVDMRSNGCAEASIHRKGIADA